jgi:hypothetical protein
MFWRRRRELKERVRNATEEAEISRDRLETARRDVVEPLVTAGRRNQFADLIRDSLINGRRKAAS